MDILNVTLHNAVILSGLGEWGVIEHCGLQFLKGNCIKEESSERDLIHFTLSTRWLKKGTVHESALPLQEGHSLQ